MVSKCADRGRRGAGRVPHDFAQSQLTESNMHPAAASQSKPSELGSLVLARWPKTFAREERRGVERKEVTLTGAQALI
jgi:hypothetical protein